MTFCLLILRTKSFLHGVISGRKEFAPMGANSFFYEMTPDEMRDKNENKTEAFPESVFIHLK